MVFAHRMAYFLSGGMNLHAIRNSALLVRSVARFIAMSSPGPKNLRSTDVTLVSGKR
jgi:hypothetical protein